MGDGGWCGEKRRLGDKGAAYPRATSGVIFVVLCASQRKTKPVVEVIPRLGLEPG